MSNTSKSQKAMNKAKDIKRGSERFAKFVMQNGLSGESFHGQRCEYRRHMNG